MGVTGKEQRPVGTGLGPIVADRLGGGGNVVVVEADPQTRASVSGSPERNPLLGDGRIGMLAVVRGYEASDVHEVGTLGRLPARGSVGTAGLLGVGARQVDDRGHRDFLLAVAATRS